MQTPLFLIPDAWCDFHTKCCKSSMQMPFIQFYSTETKIAHATWHLQFFEEPECYMWIAGGSPQAEHGIFGG